MGLMELVELGMGELVGVVVADPHCVEIAHGTI